MIGLFSAASQRPNLLSLAEEFDDWLIFGRLGAAELACLLPLAEEFDNWLVFGRPLAADPAFSGGGIR